MNTTIQNCIKIMNETIGHVAGILNTINNKFNKAKKDCPMDKKTLLIIVLVIFGIMIISRINKQNDTAAQWRHNLASQGSNITDTAGRASFDSVNKPIRMRY